MKCLRCNLSEMRWNYGWHVFLCLFTAAASQRWWDREPTRQPNYYHYDDQYRNWNSRNRPYETRVRYYSDEYYPYKEMQDSRCGEETREPVVRTVETGQGVVEGRVVFLCDGPDISYRDRPQPGSNPQFGSKFHKNVTVFLGIPYAKPPVQELRFEHPKHPDPWGNLKTLRYKPPCPQPEDIELTKVVGEPDEDCLYLNVFSPFVEKFYQRKYAVMIYIHGGFWEKGSANTFPAHILAASQEVVVVTFNYRLGPLGFFATANRSAPGNYGILDQAKVINWVYENIDKFNGDPQRITLFGSGAGAASAGIHMFSEVTSTLVKGVIAQSGAAVADWAVITDPEFLRNNSILYGIELGCDTRSSENLLNCLRKRTFKELVNSKVKRKVGWVTWAPVVDGYTRVKDRVLPDTPENLLKYHNFNLRPNFAYMTGVTRDEAVTMILKDKELYHLNGEITESYFKKQIQMFAEKYNYTLFPEALYNAIEFMYLPWSDAWHTISKNKTLLRECYINMFSDAYYKAPNDKMIKLLLNNKIKTYMYVLNYTAEGLQKPKWHGIPHDSEYIFITGAPFMDPQFYPSYLKLNEANWTEADRNMSQFFMEAWANFAKYGNPTPKSILNAILWEPMQAEKLQYLSINTTNMTSVMLENYKQRESQFWNFYIPRLIQKITPTWPPTLEPIVEELRIYQASLWGVVALAGLFLLLTLTFCFLFCCRKSAKPYDDIDDTIDSSKNLNLNMNTAV
ncbi:acetylcholinesterase-like [Centruroides sculpturatus]|uniref:acetylcholinesterase-like n=1 Tax=Centruroides sculpturatus TaxID=218467 RepID=UPI000C6D1BE2|nr:acetylcholinesterase-like [Centruroides sculpturatus]